MVIQLNIKKQLRYFYAFEAVICFRITDVVWVLFLLNRGYSLAQVGIAEGIFHLTSLVCEVPSGMAADVFGRKRTLVLSGIAGILSSFFMGFGDRIEFIFWGMIFSAVAISMLSGTEEAILYDSLVEADQEKQYKEARVLMSIIARVCSTASCLFSPIAIFMGYRNVYLFSAFLNAIQVYIALKLKEPVVTEKQSERQKNPFGQIKQRWKQHIYETVSFIKCHPDTMCKLLASAAIACPCYLTLMYLQEHLVNCGWAEEWIGIPMFVIPMAGTVGAWFASKSRQNLLRAAFVCGVVGGIGTIIAGSSLIIFAIAGAMAGRMCEGYFEIMVSERTNQDFHSDQRATMISIDSMLYSILMITISPLTGYLGEQYNMQILFAALGGSLFVFTVIGLWSYKVVKSNR